MAERRMFTKKITESDAFLDMPSSTQMLYFHLSMNADDDGFVNNPRKIQRMCGASDDDFKLLLLKSFVLSFDSGVIVIKHWKMHNYIQSDRYKPTDYIDEKSTLGLKSNKAYTLNESKMVTKCIQDVSIGKVRVDKNSKGKTNIIEYETAVEVAEPKRKKTSKPDYEITFEKIWEYYPRKVNKGGAYKAYQARLNAGYSEGELMQAVVNYADECKKNGTLQKYIKHGSTFFGSSTPFVDYLDKNYGGGEVNEYPGRNNKKNERDSYADSFFGELG